MLEYIKNIALALVFAGVCAIAAWVLQTKKQQLLAIVANLIQEAEGAIQGSGLGAEKKAKVVAQLQAMGIKVNAWLDAQIDYIVKYLNEKGGWFAAGAGDTAKEAADAAAAVTAGSGDAT